MYFCATNYTSGKVYFKFPQSTRTKSRRIHFCFYSVLQCIQFLHLIIRRSIPRCGWGNDDGSEIFTWRGVHCQLKETGGGEISRLLIQSPLVWLTEYDGHVMISTPPGSLGSYWDSHVTARPGLFQCGKRDVLTRERYPHNPLYIHSACLECSRREYSILLAISLRNQV